MSDHVDEPRVSGIWQHLARTLADWRDRVMAAADAARARAALRSEFADLDRVGELDHVLGDLGLTRLEVSTVVANHPGAARRLATMMWRLGIADDPVIRANPEMRSIERGCLLCTASGKCERWLRSGDPEGHREFCPNSEAFDRLRVLIGAR